MNQLIIKLLYKFSNMGVNLSDEDAILIGKAPHVGSEAWLNRIYSPISKNEVEFIERTIQRQIPYSYIFFLTRFSNGLNILCDTLCLFGFRKNYNRNLNAVWEPYSITDLNNYEKPSNANENMFFIGGYEWDGSLLYMTPDERIHFCRRDDSTSLCSWENLSLMLISEIERLYTLFDANGVQIDDNQPTTPL